MCTWFLEKKNSSKIVEDVFFISWKANIFRDLFPLLHVLPQLKASVLPKTNCKQIAIPEWNGTNFPTLCKSMYIAVVHDLINLKINGSKKSPFQILGSNHCNFLPRFPIGPSFSAVLDPGVTLYYCTTTQLHPSDGHKLYNFKEKRLPGFRKPVFCLLPLNNTIFFQ